MYQSPAGAHVVLSWLFENERNPDLELRMVLFHVSTDCRRYLTGCMATRVEDRTVACLHCQRCLWDSMRNSHVQTPWCEHLDVLWLYTDLSVRPLLTSLEPVKADWITLIQPSNVASTLNLLELTTDPIWAIELSEWIAEREPNQQSIVIFRKIWENAGRYEKAHRRKLESIWRSNGWYGPLKGPDDYQREWNHRKGQWFHTLRSESHSKWKELFKNRSGIEIGLRLEAGYWWPKARPTRYPELPQLEHVQPDDSSQESKRLKLGDRSEAQ